ncbi:MAG: hypothetical protein ACRDAP_19795 [Shewanella sp.]
MAMSSSLSQTTQDPDQTSSTGAAEERIKELKELQASAIVTTRLLELLPREGQGLLKVSIKQKAPTPRDPSNIRVHLEPSNKGKVLLEIGRFVFAPAPDNSGLWQLMVTAGPDYPMPAALRPVKNEKTLDRMMGLHHVTIQGQPFVFKVGNYGLATVSYKGGTLIAPDGSRSTRL